MRLALDVRPLLDPTPSGVGAYTYSLLSAMAELESVQVVPVVTGRKPASLPQSAGSDLVQLKLPNPLVNTSLRFLKFPRLDRLARCQRYLLPNWNFLAINKKTELTLVVHDLSFERNPNWYSRKQRLWHNAVGPRKLVERADRIIAVSNWTKQDLLDCYDIRDEQKIYIVPPVADRPRAELRFPIKLPERFILFLGTVEERKNPLSLVTAFDRIADKHRDVHLLIAGKGGFGHGKVKKAVNKSPHRDRVHLFGYVPSAVRQSLYHQAAIFAYPSFYEGFGIPLVEAMHAGLPVIAGNRSAMPEVVGDAGILVDPYDVTQLALALDELLSDQSFAAALGQKGRERSKLFPDSMAPELRKFFG